MAVDTDGTAVAVTVVDGELHAFEDTCPHAGCSLAEGSLDGNTVVCPCHLARFDITTGAVLEGPAPSGIGVWAARVTDGMLLLDGPRQEAPPADVSPSASGDPVSATSPPDQDITVLIEREHDAFRRQFDTLDAVSDSQELEKAWTTLAQLLEIHASGEESILYPQLVRAAEEEVEEAEHAVRDHNEIRDSVRDVQEHAVGSQAWWEAVRTARQVNEDHLREEEQDVLPPFRNNVDRARREQLGRRWLAFHDEHQGARGLSNEDVDPRSVVNQPDT